MKDKYRLGEVLYGDDFSIDEIQNWYNEEPEPEAYAYKYNCQFEWQREI